MQPPGSPGTSATKVGFKNKGNPAAVRLGDIFEIQNSIEFGQKNHDLFGQISTSGTNKKRSQKDRKLKRMQKIHIKLQRAKKAERNRNMKKNQTSAEKAWKLESGQSHVPSTNKAPTTRSEPEKENPTRI